MRGTTSNIVYQMYNIPVKVANLQRADSTGLKQACPKCQGSVGRKNVCKGCDAELESSEILKAFPIGNQNHIFTKEQIDSLKDFDDVIEVLGSIPKEQIDQRWICGAFAVLPDKKQKKKQIKMFEKAWKVLQTSIEDSENALVVKFSTRQKQKMGIMTSIGGILTLLHVVYGENSIEIDEYPQVEITDVEKQQGIVFLEKLSKINPMEIENDFAVKLEKLVESNEPLTVTVPEQGGDDGMSFFS